MINRARILEAIAVCGVLAMGLLVGSFTSRHAAMPDFYQRDYGPAVMLASGHGFVNPSARAGSPLAEFLALRRSSLDRSDLLQVSTGPLDQVQQGTRYLLLLVGYWWKFAGISWPAVSGVEALMYGLTLVACYSICRLWLPRTWSVLAAAFVAVSPVHLRQVSYLRDYVKAPFILFAIPLVVLVATRPVSRRRLVWLSAACGAVVGMGVGFRMDVLVMTPIFIFSVLCFRDRRPWTGLAEKGLAVGVFLLALTLASAPIVFRLSAGGSNAFHSILLGYSDPFDAGLGTVRSVYSFMPFYSDVYVQQVVQERAAGPHGEVVQLTTAAYDAATRGYWEQIIRHFPADILTRALGASNYVLNLPFRQPSLDFLTPPFSKFPGVGAIFEYLSTLNGWGLVLGAVLVGAAGAQSARLGVFAVWMVLALTGYSSLQFQERHFFHLEIIPVVGALLALRLIARRRLPSRMQFARFAAAILAMAVAVGTSLGILRAYQSMHLKRVFQEYADAPRHAVPPVFSETGHGTWHMTWDESSATRAPAADYYEIEFGGAAGPPASWLDFRYEGVAPDYARTTPMSAGGDRMFVPAYGDPPVRAFQGLELSSGAKRRLRGIYRIDSPERLPLLLTLRLPDDWRKQGLYEIFRVEGSRDAGAVPVIGDPASTPASRIAWLDRVDSPATLPSADAVAEAYSPAVHVTRDGIAMDSVAHDQSSYLAGFKTVDVRAPGALLVRGHLYAGGLSLGVLRGVNWYRQVVVRSPGDFVAVINIPDAGTYAPLITNATPRTGERTSFVLSRFGVVSAE